MTVTRHVAGRHSWPQLLAGAWANLGLSAAIAQRTVSTRYKQTVLGFGWALLQPAATFAIFTVFFGRVAGIDPGDGSYAAFALSAIVPWQLVAALVTEGGVALASESAVLRRVALTPLALVLGRAAPCAIPFTVGVVLMLALAPVVGARPGAQLLWLPLLTVATAVPALALAIALSAMGVWVRDVLVGLPFLVQALLLASPVAWPIVGLSDRWSRALAALNPIVGPLEGFRRVYVTDRPPALDLLAISGASSLVLLALALEIFRRLEPEMADVA